MGPPGRNDVMRNVRDIAKRLTALSLAAWICVLTAIIEDPHQHSRAMEADEPCECSFFAGSAAHCTSNLEPQSATAVLANAVDPKRPVPGGCPACLFIKSCNEKAAGWVWQTPIRASGSHKSQEAPCLHGFALLLSRSPRAPPQYLS